MTSSAVADAPERAHVDTATNKPAGTPELTMSDEQRALNKRRIDEIKAGLGRARAIPANDPITDAERHRQQQALVDKYPDQFPEVSDVPEHTETHGD